MSAHNTPTLFFIFGCAVFQLSTSVLAQQGDDPQITPSPRRPDDSNGAHIESLLRIASSLLNVHYPSTTITDIASLKWPATVVIGSSTAVLSTPRTSISTASFSTLRSSTSTEPAATPIAAPEAAPVATVEEEDGTDLLGPVMGGVIGGIALIAFVLLLIFCCRRRHQRRQRLRKSFIVARPDSPLGDAEIGALRASESPSRQPEMHQRQPMYLPPTGRFSETRPNVGDQRVGPPLGNDSSHLSTAEQNPFLNRYEIADTSTPMVSASRYSNARRSVDRHSRHNSSNISSESDGFLAHSNRPSVSTMHSDGRLAPDGFLAQSNRPSVSTMQSDGRFAPPDIRTTESGYYEGLSLHPPPVYRVEPKYNIYATDDNNVNSNSFQREFLTHPTYRSRSEHTSSISYSSGDGRSVGSSSIPSNPIPATLSSYHHNDNPISPGIMKQSPAYPPPPRIRNSPRSRSSLIQGHNYHHYPPGSEGSDFNFGFPERNNGNL